MKRLLLWLYLLTYFLIPHIRWISPITSARWVYGAPLYAGLIFCLIASLCLPALLLEFHWPRISVYVLALVFFGALFVQSVSPSTWLESSYVMFLLIGFPLVGIGAPLVLMAMNEPRFARHVLTILSVACLVQVIFMILESSSPNMLFLVRPNAEGTGLAWNFTNRYGSNRSMYTLTDPMSAGAWAWFTGITLIVLTPLAKGKLWQRWFFALTGCVTIGSIVLTLSRGPVMIAVISIIVLLPYLLNTRLKIATAIIGTLVGGLFIFMILSTSKGVGGSLMDSLEQLASEAFSPQELGNGARINVWLQGLEFLGQSESTGKGLDTISFLSDALDVNFENTFLTIIYGTGLAGLAYSIVLIVTWVIQTVKVAHCIFTRKRATPQLRLCLACAIAWLPYMFIFPCLRGIECSFITFSILGSLVFLRKKVPSTAERLIEMPPQHNPWMNASGSGSRFKV